MYVIATESVENGTVQGSLEKLNMMLKARKSMKTNKTSKLNTDMFVGNQLGKEFIYPKTQNPSADDMQKAVTKIQNGSALKELESLTSNSLNN